MSKKNKLKNRGSDVLKKHTTKKEECPDEGVEKKVEHEISDFPIYQEGNIDEELMLKSNINFLFIQKEKIASIIAAVKEVESAMSGAIAEAKKSGYEALNAENFALIHEKPLEKIEGSGEKEKTSLLSVIESIQVMQKAVELMQELEKGKCNGHSEKILKSLRTAALVMSSDDECKFSVAPVEIQMQEGSHTIVDSEISKHIQEITEIVDEEIQEISKAIIGNIDAEKPEISIEKAKVISERLDSAVKKIMTTGAAFKKALDEEKKADQEEQEVFLSAAFSNCTTEEKPLEPQGTITAANKEENSEGASAAHQLHSLSNQTSNEGDQEGRVQHEFAPKLGTTEVAAKELAESHSGEDRQQKDAAVLVPAVEAQEGAASESSNEVSGEHSSSQRAAETRGADGSANPQGSPHLLEPKTNEQDVTRMSQDNNVHSDGKQDKDTAAPRSGHEAISNIDDAEQKTKKHLATAPQNSSAIEKDSASHQVPAACGASTLVSVATRANAPECSAGIGTKKSITNSEKTQMTRGASHRVFSDSNVRKILNTTRRSERPDGSTTADKGEVIDATKSSENKAVKFALYSNHTCQVISAVVWLLTFMYFFILTINTCCILALGSGFISIAPSIIQFSCNWIMLVSAANSLLLTFVDGTTRAAALGENLHITCTKVSYASRGATLAVCMSLCCALFAYGEYFVTAPTKSVGLSFTTSVPCIAVCLLLCSVIALGLFSQSAGNFLTNTAYRNLEGQLSATMACDQAKEQVFTDQKTASVFPDTVLQAAPASTIACSENDASVRVEAATSFVRKK
ncbi:MAG: hypothetical protein AB8U44_03715 [Aaplasma endosymbiont of Hyalomma asiaticum]